MLGHGLKFMGQCLKIGATGRGLDQLFSGYCGAVVFGRHVTTVEQVKTIPDKEGMLRIVGYGDDGNTTFFRLLNVLENNAGLFYS